MYLKSLNQEYQIHRNPASWHLLVQIKQLKNQSNAWNFFKVISS